MSCAPCATYSRSRSEALPYPLKGELIDQEMHQAQVVAIDAPFGWPAAFIEAVRGASEFAWPHPPGWPNALRDQLMYRHTEQHLIGDSLRPLSASTDKIALLTMRCVGLLQALGVTDRSWGTGRASTRSTHRRVCAVGGWWMPAAKSRGKAIRRATKPVATSWMPLSSRPRGCRSHPSSATSW